MATTVTAAAKQDLDISMPDIDPQKVRASLLKIQGLTRQFPEIEGVLSSLTNQVLSLEQWRLARTLSWKINYNHKYILAIQDMIALILSRGIRGYEKYRDEADNDKTREISRMWRDEIGVLLNKIDNEKIKELFTKYLNQ